MKLVQQKFRDEKKMIVSENIIKRGFDFESNQDLLTNADKENYIDFLVLSQTNELNFREYLEMYNIDYNYLPECYFSIEEIKKLAEKYKYFFDDDNNEFIKTIDILECEECNFIEYWNGHDIEQVEIEDDVIDIDLIASHIEEVQENKALFGHYNLYKDQEDNLYLHWFSYYQGNLGEVEEITENELEERFNYKL